MAAAVVVVLVPAVWFTAHQVAGNYAASSRSPKSTPQSPATTTPTGTPTDQSSPTVSPTPTPTATTSPSILPSPTQTDLASVAPDSPRRITSGSLIDTGFDSAVSTLEAASTAEVARLGSRGSPGSPGTDTVYVVGKVRTGAASGFEHLPDLKAGSRISIRTDTATLTYTVSATSTKQESALPGNKLFTRHVPGRLVLVGIRYAASGSRLGEALVVTARLTGVEKR